MLTLLICIAVILGIVIALVYAERKVAAFIQDRLGPTEVGPYGMFQAIIDVLKLLQKEDIVPATADKNLFKLAPVIIFASVLADFTVVPVSPDIIASGAEIGIFFLLSIVSLDIIGLLMAGWGSNNKYAVLGAMRSVGQMFLTKFRPGLLF